MPRRPLQPARSIPPHPAGSRTAGSIVTPIYQDTQREADDVGGSSPASLQWRRRFEPTASVRRGKPTDRSGRLPCHSPARTRYAPAVHGSHGIGELYSHPAPGPSAYCWTDPPAIIPTLRFAPGVPFRDRPANSWVTGAGRDVDSNYHRILAMNPSIAARRKAGGCRARPDLHRRHSGSARRVACRAPHAVGRRRLELRICPAMVDRSWPTGDPPACSTRATGLAPTAPPRVRAPPASPGQPEFVSKRHENLRISGQTAGTPPGSEQRRREASR
jgi:hypothetical protein